MAVAYRESLTPTQAFLTLAVRDTNSRTEQERARLAALYHQLGDAAAWQAAAENKVIPHVAHALTDALGAQGIPQRWAETHAEYAARNAQFVGELDRVSHRLDEAGIRLVAVEAGSILCGMYPCPGCFSSEDIDLLADPSQASIVDQVMQAAGFKADVQQWAGPSSRQGYRRTLAASETLWLIMMWEPLSRLWVAPVERLDNLDIINRSVPISGRDTHLRLPSPEDHLLLCAMHTSIHGYVRSPGLRLHLDVDRVVRYRPLDWDIVVIRAGEWRIKKRVFIALAMAAGLLGTPVPETVLDRLVPDETEQAQPLTILAEKGVFDTGLAKFGRLEFVRFEASLDDGGWLRGLARAAFPSRDWMRKRYALSSGWQLPLCYLRRLGSVARGWNPSA